MPNAAESLAAVNAGAGVTVADAASPEHSDGAAVLLRVEHVARSFGAVRALRDATMDLRRGEVHVLMGENGSGKSTLVKILSGVQRPDAGAITVAGQVRSAITSPRQARQLGIVPVFQEVLSAPSCSVLDNVWLGTDDLLHARTSREHKRKRASELLAELLGEVPDLDAPIGALSLSQRQGCAIVRALVADPSVLILDEATSALDVATRDRLLAIVRRLSAGGVGTIFISHRIDEVQEIGSRVTVLRSGLTVATVAEGAWTPAELVRLMSGGASATGNARGARDTRDAAPVLLRAEQVRLRAGAAPVDVEIRQGELIGLAGLEGHGQEEFLHTLLGHRRHGGTVWWNGGPQPVAVRTSRQAAQHGIVGVPRDRSTQSIFRQMSIRENFALATLPADRRLGLQSDRRADRRLAEWTRRLSITLGSPSAAIGTLSGGNQQKVVLARWLAADPRMLLLNDPTRGIDINAKRDIYRLVVQLADDGMTVIMLSTEIDEHLELMDRVLVFREQTLATELTRDQLTRERLVASYFGQYEQRDGLA